MIALERLLAALDREGVRYIVIGGMAARAHGSSRVTQDIDLVYARSDEDIRRMVRALKPFDPYLRGVPDGLPFEWSERTLRGGLNFSLTTAVGDVDLFGEVLGGGDYGALEPHTIQAMVFGHRTLFLNIDWLIRVKRAAGRPKDLETIAELELLREEGRK